MRTRLRSVLLALLATAAVAALPLTPGPGVAWADGPCMNGTNWDNIRLVCV